MGSAGEGGVSEESPLGIPTLEKEEVVVIWEQKKGIQKSKGGRQFRRLTSLLPSYCELPFPNCAYKSDLFDVNSDYTLIFIHFPEFHIVDCHAFAGIF